MRRWSSPLGISTSIAPRSSLAEIRSQASTLVQRQGNLQSAAAERAVGDFDLGSWLKHLRAGVTRAGEDPNAL